MPERPHVTVATVVEKDNKFLFTLESIDSEERINQPAGHVEASESLEEAAIRETLEETGWLVVPVALLGIRQYTAPSNGVTYLRFTYIAKAINEIENAVLDKGIIRPLWLDYNEVKGSLSRHRSPLVLHDVEAYLAGQSLPLDTIVDIAPAK